MNGSGDRPAATIVLAEPPMNGWGLRAPLEALGHDVVGHAEDGEAAVDLAARLNPDLVVLDVQLPGLGGIGAAERLQAPEGRGLVFVASHWDPAMLDAAVGAGALACLVRPLGVVQLGLSILVALERGAEIAALRGARTELLSKLEARKRAVRAKGILMRRLGIDEDRAHLLLQHRARNTRRPLGSAIDEVLAADHFFADLERSLRGS
ncbi:MAG TPA: ANTAR domain-containing protein [Candidatus Sulfotelmatobacter sp.]|nr:ANTAR domain-containing protein [Candidatus Sulfotelmatobacter sp.]